MNAIDMIINWEYLPSLLALIAGFAAGMAFGTSTFNGTIAARRRKRQRRLRAQRGAEIVMERSRESRERSEQDPRINP